MTKRKMLQFSPELHEFLYKKVTRGGYLADIKKMFGHEVFFLNGYMFTGANELGIFVHIGHEAVLAALEKEKGVAPFSPMEGMIMKDYLLLEKGTYENARKFSKWLKQSSAYLMAKSPKKKKAKTK
jgi:TfoX/Sxy family transcriptional regulator of competence genes